MESAKKNVAGTDTTILYVYTREPHANQRLMGFDFRDEKQTRSIQERVKNAKHCHDRWEFTIPWIIDDMKGTIQRAYGGLPNSGFVIRSDGIVAYKEPWAKGGTLEPEILKLHPPGYYLASKKEKAELLKLYEAAVPLRRARDVEKRLAAADALRKFTLPAVLPRLAMGLGDSEKRVRERVWGILKDWIEIRAGFYEPGESEKTRVPAAKAVVKCMKAAEWDYKWDPKKKRFVPKSSRKKIKWPKKPAEEKGEGF
ncbi:MAG: hypothetical protein ACYTHM_16925 [Planctomycetota bacterium]